MSKKYLGQGRDFGGAGLLNIANASADSSVPSWGQVKALVLGLGSKFVVDVASTANVAIATALENGDALDGVTLTTGMAVLLKNQTTQTENGVYVVPASGAASRHSEWDSTADFANGALISVRQGTANNDTLWLMTNNTPPTLGSDNITFASVNAGSTYTAGAGMTESSGTFNVIAGDNSLTINANDMIVKRKGTGLVLVDADGIYVDTSVLARKYGPTLIGDGSLTTINVDHNLGTRDISGITLRDVSTHEIVDADYDMATSANRLTLKFNTAPANNGLSLTFIY